MNGWANIYWVDASFVEELGPASDESVGSQLMEN